MLLTPCNLVYSVYWSINAINKMQRYTNHKTRFMKSITATSFGTEVPSSGSLRTQSIRKSTNTKDHKSNNPLWVLITLAAIFKMWKSRIHNFTYSGIVTWKSGAETCRGDTYKELSPISCILLYFVVGHYTSCNNAKWICFFCKAIYVLNQITICILATASNFTHDETGIWLWTVH